VGAIRLRVLVYIPECSLMDIAEPCKVRLWLLAPTVNDEVGVMAVRAVRLVMSLFTPLAAALRLDLALVALMAPVPPLVIGRAVLRVRAEKVGVEVVAIPCTVSTLPLVTVKLVELNEARPLMAAVASWMVIVPPAVTILVPVIEVRVMAPVWLLTLVTPEPPLLVRQVGQDRLPKASSSMGPVTETAMVPLAFGITMDLLLPDGVVKLRVLV
jgi:hypothetical protein